MPLIFERAAVDQLLTAFVPRPEFDLRVYPKIQIVHGQAELFAYREYCSEHIGQRQQPHAVEKKLGWVCSRPSKPFTILRGFG